MFAWTERILPPDIWDPNLAAGGYVFKVADLSYPPNAALSNIQTFQPGSVPAGGEVESISPDKSRIAVYSTFESQNIVATPLYTITLSNGQTTKLTTESFSQCPTYTPDGNHFVYMTGKDCDIFPWQLQGADWWIMNNDSTNKVRLTYMNVTGHPQCVNAYRLAGSLSFMSNTSFLGGIMTQSLGLTGYTAKVDFSNMVSVPETDADPAVAFSLFPSPVSDVLNLDMDHSLTDFTVRIYDLAGKEILSQKNMRQLDVSALAAGSYMVEIVAGENSGRQLFLKN